jgi:AraC-like DNA-binding protein
MRNRDYATRIHGRDDTIFTLLSGKHHFEKHTHDTYSVGIMLSGYSFFSRENKKEILHSGKVFIANPEEVHNCECGKDCDDWVYANIYPSVALMEELYMELGGDSSKVPIFPDACVEDSPLAQNLQTLFGKIIANNEMLDLEASLVEILSQLILENADKRGKKLNSFEDISPKEIARTLEYLESAKDLNSISVKELAKVAGYSQYHFIRVFKQIVGMTPYAYAAQLRVLRARNMLLKGVPIVDSAQESGFSDQAHMTREFKKIFGVTPGKFL